MKRRRLSIEIAGDPSGVALPPIEDSDSRGLEPIPRIAGPRLTTPGVESEFASDEEIDRSFDAYR